MGLHTEYRKMQPKRIPASEAHCKSRERERDRERTGDRQTDRQTDGRTDRQTDRETLNNNNMMLVILCEASKVRFTRVLMFD